MVRASGISLYVLFSSSPKDSPRIVQQLIVKPSNEGNGTIYKIANEVAKDLKQELPPLTSINSKGLALSMYIRNTSCDRLRTKALSHSPLKSITRQEWLVANSQIYDPNLKTESTELSIPEWLKPSQVNVIMKQEQINRFKYISIVYAGTPDPRVFDWIKEQHFVSLPILIYATDGYGAFPEIQPNFPVIWIAFQKSIDLKKFPFGEVIELDSSFNLGSTHKPNQ
jgi:hypothetical protein